MNIALEFGFAEDHYSFLAMIIFRIWVQSDLQPSCHAFVLIQVELELIWESLFNFKNCIIDELSEICATMSYQVFSSIELKLDNVRCLLIASDLCYFI
jgi:hypothetical protein